jgi:hypothetical protein
VKNDSRYFVQWTDLSRSIAGARAFVSAKTALTPSAKTLAVMAIKVTVAAGRQFRTALDEMYQPTVRSTAPTKGSAAVLQARLAANTPV